jgi:DNA-binding MarR family transcriptional regulator
MTDPAAVENAVYNFVLDQIETVPHLEALLLLWNSRPQPWTVENLAKRLYVSTNIVNSLLEDLKRRGLIV